MKIRSFLAFDISENMRKDLTGVVSYLSSKVENVRWIKPELMHCTVYFFGEVEEDLLLGDISKSIESVLKKHLAINLTGKGLGVFPNWRYPKVIWAGLIGGVEEALELNSGIVEAMDAFSFKQDRRAFRLHLTIGRMKPKFKDAKQLVSLVERMGEKEFGSVRVDTLTLYKSVLTEEGSVYTPLKTFNIKK